MTDIEKVIEKIKELNNSIAYEEINAHLVCMCHFDTVRIIEAALKEAGIELRKDYVHFYASDYYIPGDIYIVTDKKLKREILKQHGIKIYDRESMYYDYNYSTNFSYNYTYIDSKDKDELYCRYTFLK